MLTRWIAAEAGEVHVIEINPGLVAALNDVASGFNNIHVIEGNALTVELPDVNKIVANLPYSMSSEITFRIIRNLNVESAVLMYQKEFASRMVAEPGTPEYSRLSVNVQYYAQIEPLMDVSAKMFYPEPAVDSTVVRVTHRTKGPFAQDAETFHWMIHGLYSYPNKNFRKAIRIWFNNLGFDRDVSQEVLERAKSFVDGSEKLRTLSLETLVRISDILQSMISEKLINKSGGTIDGQSS